MELSDIAILAGKIKTNIEKVIIGKSAELELLITALICGGHVLLDDVPGTGKTVTAKSLAKSISCDFKRIQFTPDLLPTDITGMNVFNQKEYRFEFREGPAFTNILLADELNRATPRTQSALLECMEEGQITVDGMTRKLAEPFFVIATQNPVETSGTFPLPEAQLDRFLLRLRPGYPGIDEELMILNRFILDNPLDALEPVVSGSDVISARQSYQKIHVSEPVRRYIVNLTNATRSHSDVTLGVSPRGMLWMLRASQALAAISGRTYVLPDDIKRLAAPVFAHRIITQTGYGAADKAAEIINKIVGAIAVPTEDPTADMLKQ